MYAVLVDKLVVVDGRVHRGGHGVLLVLRSVVVFVLG